MSVSTGAYANTFCPPGLLEISEDEKEISHMRERVMRIGKAYDATKKILLTKKRQVVMRTLGHKLQEVKVLNTKLQKRNEVLLQANQSLKKEVASLKGTNDQLRDFIATSVTEIFDFDNNDILEVWQEPQSPEPPSSQHMMIDGTPTKAHVHIKQPARKADHVNKILDFNDDDFTGTSNKPQSQSSSQRKRNNKSLNLLADDEKQKRVRRSARIATSNVDSTTKKE